MELFEQFYEADMEPLTEDEWVEILTKYENTFEKKDIMNDNKVTAKLKKEWQSTCLKEHFTLNEWAEIVDHFDVSEDENDEEERFDIDTFKEYYNLGQGTNLFLF